MDYLTELKNFGCVAGAMFLGAILGLERELAEKPAGMRTHMLVAGAAAMLVLLGDTLVDHFGRQFQFIPGLVRADPIRILEAIVTGVSFLGAGTIIRHTQDNAIQGLTTGATLLFTAALGICVALHAFAFALGATLLALVTLRAARVLERRLKRKAEKRA